MNTSSPLTDALLAAATIAVFFCAAGWCLYRIVHWARRRQKRAYVVGAMLTPFIALGNVRGPERIP
jgi:hypothetical protein